MITYLDDVFIQDTTTGNIANTYSIAPDNLKIAPDNSFIILNSVKFLGHQIQNNHIPPLKSKIDGFLKLQTPKNKKEIQNIVGFLNFISKKIYIRFKKLVASERLSRSGSERFFPSVQTMYRFGNFININ